MWSKGLDIGGTVLGCFWMGLMMDQFQRKSIGWTCMIVIGWRIVSDVVSVVDIVIEINGRKT